MIQEVVHKVIAFTFGDDTVAIVIILVEELVELVPGCLWSSLVLKYIVKKLKDLIPLEESASICIIFGKKFEDQLLDRVSCNDR